MRDNMLFQQACQRRILSLSLCTDMNLQASLRAGSGQCDGLVRKSRTSRIMCVHMRGCTYMYLCNLQASLEGRNRHLWRFCWRESYFELSRGVKQTRTRPLVGSQTGNRPAKFLVRNSTTENVSWNTICIHTHRHMLACIYMQQSHQHPGNVCRRALSSRIACVYYGCAHVYPCIHTCMRMCWDQRW